MKKNIPDWLIRSIKTFVQAFFGALIPAVTTMLNGGFPESWNAAWVVLAPAIAAALASAICAVWNIINEQLEKTDVMDIEIDEDVEERAPMQKETTEATPPTENEPEREKDYDPDDYREYTFLK